MIIKQNLPLRHPVQFILGGGGPKPRGGRAHRQRLELPPKPQEPLHRVEADTDGGRRGGDHPPDLGPQAGFDPQVGGEGRVGPPPRFLPSRGGGDPTTLSVARSG